jgi:cytochrome c-type biogenesis protein CcmH/NrfF
LDTAQIQSQDPIETLICEYTIVRYGLEVTYPPAFEWAWAFWAVRAVARVVE